MKLSKNIISLIISAVMLVNLYSFVSIQAFAHNEMLDVVYDACIGDDEADSIDEMWYALTNGPYCYHLSNDTATIKYYFSDNLINGYTWTTDLTPDEAEEIKNAYANSMKKWNNVYFYSYNSDGSIEKHKIINVVEGSETDHNLIIYPSTGSSVATTNNISNDGVELETGDVYHSHYPKWQMTVNVNNFYENNDVTASLVSVRKERIGAHELGHILGLKDLDVGSCNSTNETDYHHHELLMGYGLPKTDRSVNITYKDIAGVAILRGFHTDSDHKWLNCGRQSDGKYKLLCSICNGVKYVESLSGYFYYDYGTCGNNHSLSSGNMMAIASYGTKDYYKCKYCRYVAPFSSLVTQNYTKSYYSETVHKSTNQVTGLMYTFFEQHNIVNNQCLDCNGHIHSYDNNFEQYSNIQHKSYCECGESITENHTFTYVPYTNEYHKKVCACGYQITMKHDTTHFTSTTGVCSICGDTITIKGPIISPWKTEGEDEMY